MAIGPSSGSPAAEKREQARRTPNAGARWFTMGRLGREAFGVRPACRRFPHLRAARPLRSRSAPENLCRNLVVNFVESGQGLPTPTKISTKVPTKRHPNLKRLQHIQHLPIQLRAAKGLITQSHAASANRSAR